MWALDEETRVRSLPPELFACCPPARPRAQSDDGARQGILRAERVGAGWSPSDAGPWRAPTTTWRWSVDAGLGGSCLRLRGGEGSVQVDRRTVRLLPRARRLGASEEAGPDEGPLSRPLRGAPAGATLRPCRSPRPNEATPSCYATLRRSASPASGSPVCFHEKPPDLSGLCALVLRACANRDRSRVKNGHSMFTMRGVL